MRRTLINNRYGAWRRICNTVAVIACLIATVQPTRAAEMTLLALGNSLTAGYGLKASNSFTTRLEAALRESGLDVRVINAGVSGDTTAGGRARLAWSLAEKPDAMILELGANDGLRGIAPAETRANLDAILRETNRSGVPVLVAGMKAPPNLGREYAAEFEAIFPELAAKHGAALYPFFLEGVAAIPSLNQDDGIHPNPAGVAIIVERMLAPVRKLLGRN